MGIKKRKHICNPLLAGAKTWEEWQAIEEEVRNPKTPAGYKRAHRILSQRLKEAHSEVRALEAFHWAILNASRMLEEVDFLKQNEDYDEDFKLTYQVSKLRKDLRTVFPGLKPTDEEN